MRAAILVALALVLAGCGHLYGAGDVKLSDTQAIQLARHEAERRHVSLKGLYPKVGRQETGTTVYFYDPRCDAGCIDGLPVIFFIPVGKHRVTYVHDGSV